MDRTMGFGVHDPKLWFTNGESEDITIQFAGYENSKGAMLEKQYAETAGLEVIYEQLFSL